MIRKWLLKRRLDKDVNDLQKRLREQTHNIKNDPTSVFGHLTPLLQLDDSGRARFYKGLLTGRALSQALDAFRHNHTVEVYRDRVLTNNDLLREIKTWAGYEKISEDEALVAFKKIVTAAEPLVVARYGEFVALYKEFYERYRKADIEWVLKVLGK